MTIIDKGNLNSIYSILNGKKDLTGINSSKIDLKWGGLYDPTGKINRALALSSDENKIDLTRDLIKWWRCTELDSMWFQMNFSQSDSKRIQQELVKLFGEKYSLRNPEVMGSIGAKEFTIWQSIPRLNNYGASDSLDTSTSDFENSGSAILKAEGPLEELCKIPEIVLPEFAELTLPNKVKIFMPYHNLWPNL